RASGCVRAPGVADRARAVRLVPGGVVTAHVGHGGPWGRARRAAPTGRGRVRPVSPTFGRDTPARRAQNVWLTGRMVPRRGGCQSRERRRHAARANGATIAVSAIDHPSDIATG